MHSFGIQSEPSRPVGTAAGVVGRVVRFVVRSTTDWRRAVELRPISDDAVDGATVLTALAMIYAWVGDIDSAIERLAFLAKTPGGPDYGQLKFDPAGTGFAAMCGSRKSSMAYLRLLFKRSAKKAERSDLGFVP